MRIRAGDTIDGRYTVLRELGTGGMATVWLVRHDRLLSLHALKVLATTLPHLATRLMDEGRAQASLRHVNVVAVSDVIEVDGLPALVMDYVDGPSLDQLQEELGLSLPQVDDLAAQLFAGIEAAHACGLTHRDLKPENLLVDLSRQRPTLQIADFGLVKVVREEQEGRTAQGTFMGTPWYMAPEQSRDASDVDHRADLFSAGAILYELVTGKQCFPGKDLVDVFARMRDGRWTPVEELAPHLPSRVATAVRWALEPDPERRCPTVAELRRTWFDGAPPPAPHAWDEPAWRMFVKRWRTKAMLLDSAPVARSATTPAPRPPAARSPTEVTPLPRRARHPWLGATLAAGALAALLLVALLVTRLGDAPAPATPGVASAPAPAPVAPAPAPAPAPARPEPNPETLALVTPPPVPASGRGVDPAARGPRAESPPAPAEVAPAEPAPAIPAPAPAPRPPRFDLQGADGLTLALRSAGDGRLVDLSEANPGTWTLLAFFDPLVPTEVGTLELREGTVASVRCSAVARRCQARVAHTGGPE